MRLSGLGGGGNGSAPRKTAKTASPPADLKERVCEMVIAEPSKVFGIGEVIERLSLNRSTASVYLSELAKENRIKRLALGKYQAMPKAQSVTPTTKTVATNKTDYEMLPGRILALFAERPTQTFDAPTIARQFGLSGESNLNSIRGALSRLNRGGKISRTGRGGYKALAPAAGTGGEGGATTD